MRRYIAYGVAVVLLVAGLVWAQTRGATPETTSVEDDAVETPRTADGKPDLAGIWIGGGRSDERFAQTFRDPALQGRPLVDDKGNVRLTVGIGRDGSLTNFERDNSMTTRSESNKPIYRAELWDKVQELDENRNELDPGYGCLPPGVPRLGPPAKIVQGRNEFVFLYPNDDTFRVIPVDGRPLPPVEKWEGRWHGQAVGRWEDDTLVVETVDFNDTSWLAMPGYFHTEDMRVVERITRKGNSLTWQATVHDPAVLQQPWEMTALTLPLDTNPMATVPEALPCSERDLEHLVTKEAH